MYLDPGLLAAIIADPTDDLHRLVYADWLDERGDPRGEFIRVQVKISRWPVERCDTISAGCLMRGREVLAHGHRCQVTALRTRERSLLAIHGEDWALYGLIRPAGIAVGGPRRWLEPLRLVDKATVGNEFRDTRGIIMEWQYSRGFVSSLTCTGADWIRHADSITAATPLERVTLTTMPHWPNADNDQYLTNKRLYMTWPRIEFTLPQPGGTISPPATPPTESPRRRHRPHRVRFLP